MDGTKNIHQYHVIGYNKYTKTYKTKTKKINKYIDVRKKYIIGGCKNFEARKAKLKKIHVIVLI